MKINRLISNLLLLLLSFNAFSVTWLELTFSDTSNDEKTKLHITDNTLKDIVTEDMKNKHGADLTGTRTITEFTIEPTKKTSSRIMYKRGEQKLAEQQSNESVELQDDKKVSFPVDDITLFCKETDLPHIKCHLEILNLEQNSNLNSILESIFASVEGGETVKNCIFKKIPRNNRTDTDRDENKCCDEDVLKYSVEDASLVATRAFFTKLAELVLNK